MSHRKYEAPRHGSLGFLPRKRCRRKRGRIRSFPHDKPTRGVNDKLWKKADGVHLTGFMGYKAGMSHTLRNFERQGIKVVTLETCEPVTVIECPPMSVIGVVGYIQTVNGIRPFKTVWTKNIKASARRRLASNWYKSKKNFFKHHRYRYNSAKARNERELKLKLMREKCCTIRVICHTKPTMLNIGVKRAHIMEIQLNGGTCVGDKVDYALKILGKNIEVDQVFGKNDFVDTIGISRGKGFKGVVSRWGVTRLPRKTHKGLRKVACIGAWHPAKVTTTVARAGQKGVFHRTVVNNKIFDIRIGEDNTSGSTKNDLTKKSINPISGFPNYGFVKHKFIVIKGSCIGATKSCITLRKSIKPSKTKRANEEIEVKFYDTASKVGRGRFQTRKEKRNFFGETKKQRMRREKLKLDNLDGGGEKKKGKKE